MKLTAEKLAQRLASELGADAVSLDADLLSSHRVDSKQPALVCTPDRESASAALRLCAEADAAITPWGGGSAMALGNPPRQVDVVLDTSRLDRVIDHDPANLTVTVESGITLTGLQSSLSAQRQFVPVDPPFPERSTVGGIVAGNLNGPRRSYYGSVRDLVIGMKVSLISGERIKAGGKVVKNVAGYDMCKLFVGSLGTLGIITELTLRLTPVPEAEVTLAASGSLLELSEFAGEILDSVLLPSAIVLWTTETSSSSETPQLGWQMAVRAEGFAEHVGRHLRDLKLLAERLGLATVSYANAAHEKLWAGISDFPILGHELVYRLMVPRSATGDLLHGLQDLGSTHSSPAIVADMAAGAIWIGSNETRSATAQFSQLQSKAAQHNGHVALVDAPAEVKRDLDIWGPTPAAFFLMRKIKQQFDPHRLMNPGRFVGRL